MKSINKVIVDSSFEEAQCRGEEVEADTVATDHLTLQTLECLTMRRRTSSLTLSLYRTALRSRRHEARGAESQARVRLESDRVRETQREAWRATAAVFTKSREEERERNDA